MALMRSCRWLLWEFKVAMSSCRLAGVWFEDEVVDVVIGWVLIFEKYGM